VRSLSKPDALKQVAKAESVIGRLTVIEMDAGDGRSVATAVKDLLVEIDNTIDVVVAYAGYGDVEWFLGVVTGSGYREWLLGVVTADMGVERPFPPYPPSRGDEGGAGRM